MSGGRTAMTQSHSVHGGALSFMSCTSGRESSPLDENDSHQTGEFKTETKKKRFHPLRNLRRMFRRKNRHSNISNDSYNISSPESTEISTTPLEQRSCSASKLVEENGMQNLIKSSRLAPGLSLSHDSVFTPDRADSGLSSSDLENSSLSISNFVPPPMEFPLKSHSSCSESSLLSMDSSEAEIASPTAVKSDLDLGITSFMLNHSAARHKMAVKPKRNHGAPRSRRRTVNSRSPLPTTPEVNEEVSAVKGLSLDSTDFFEDVPITSKPSSPVVEIVNESVKPKLFDSETPPKLSRKEDNDVKEPVEELKPKEECLDVQEDDWGDDLPRKEESFFGRLLSRRSEKKKKNNQEKTTEEPADETKCTSPTKEPLKSSAISRNVNRRQRVEPIEIPSSPSPAKKADCGNRMKISYSMSPPKSVLSNPIISRSSSPPKVVWPEHFSYYKNAKDPVDTIAKTEARNSVHEDTFSKIRRDLSPNVSKTKETQKIIADEVESKFKLLHASPRDASPKVISHEKEDDKFKVKKEIDKGLFKCEKIKSSKVNMKSDTNGCTDKLEEKDVLITHEEPQYANLKNILPSLSNYDKVHHGYENVQVIELVKKEEKPKKSEEVEKKEKVTKRDVTDGTPEFMKVQLNRVEPRNEENPNPPRVRSTLIERRKSELMLMNEADEKDWKKVKVLKKQTSFSENARSPENPIEKTETTEEVCEVVMRKKPNASGKTGDDQPELMKVFARRSLKVRESEEIVEEMRRSRDSDKENENSESPKEERKKIKSEGEEKVSEKVESEYGKKCTEEVVIQVTPLKPEIVSRKSVFQKYGRIAENGKVAKPVQENGLKQRKDSVLEENKSNKMVKEAKTEVVAASCVKEANSATEEESEETGFKRIQQRKAEWERRVQQAAK